MYAYAPPYRRVLDIIPLHFEVRDGGRATFKQVRDNGANGCSHLKALGSDLRALESDLRLFEILRIAFESPRIGFESPRLGFESPRIGSESPRMLLPSLLIMLREPLGLILELWRPIYPRPGCGLLSGKVLSAAFFPVRSSGQGSLLHAQCGSGHREPGARSC